MTREDAVIKTRKLLQIAKRSEEDNPDDPQAKSARMHVARMQEKFGITDTELAPPRVVASTTGVDELDDLGEFLRNFEDELRVAILVEGRKVGRFDSHPHVQKILEARQRKAAGR